VSTFYASPLYYADTDEPASGADWSTIFVVFVTMCSSTSSAAEKKHTTISFYSISPNVRRIIIYIPAKF